MSIQNTSIDLEPAHKITYRRGPYRGRERHWERAIGSLIRCKSIRAAAEDSGISLATIMRWLKNPRFNEALADEKKRLMQSANNLLIEAAYDSVRVMQEMANNPNVGDSARIMAALKIVEFAQKASTIESLEQRLNAVERNVTSEQLTEFGAPVIEARNIDADADESDDSDSRGGWSSSYNVA